ncbi:MAG: hypothetical protein OMM_07271 [Candidatus Magnetoglobus multicellularis str. Araruama]|uniref:Oxaloacetate decarboxylase, gamma chain n=1 Tax=Candidatus Magnetoglobus multicellularis str. Araruama TaxID=890399 RepID=A0A1V1PDN5_9BACT|nr:MAG: hypothetical protein OMM_07271 [Candidatus Magnetoglobus multicellularis str. Araruama]
MYGFEAISEHNGWAISIVGVLIVFTGLVTLSLLIRLFPKIIEIIEGTGKPKSQSKNQKKVPFGLNTQWMIKLTKRSSNINT